MPHLSLQYKAYVIGQLETGVLVRRGAALFGVSPSTIYKLRTRYHETGEVEDRPLNGHPGSTNPRKTGSSLLLH